MHGRVCNGVQNPELELGIIRVVVRSRRKTPGLFSKRAMDSHVPFVDRSNGPKRKLAATECNCGSRHGCSIKTRKTMLAITAMVRDPCGYQRMRNLHQHCAGPGKTAHQFAIDPPEDR